MMEAGKVAQFMTFLQEDLAIPSADLQVALRHSEPTLTILPMVLWQYGFLTLAQLDKVFDWLEGSV